MSRVARNTGIDEGDMGIGGTRGIQEKNTTAEGGVATSPTSPVPILRFLPTSPSSALHCFTSSASYLPAQLVPSLALPGPSTVIFIFIIIEEAEALQGMFHRDAKTGGPASGEALSLLRL